MHRYPRTLDAKLPISGTYGPRHQMLKTKKKGDVIITFTHVSRSPKEKKYDYEKYKGRRTLLLLLLFVKSKRIIGQRLPFFKYQLINYSIVYKIAVLSVSYIRVFYPN